MENVTFLTPVGRMVMGSLYVPQTTNADNQPLLVKNGPNAGQPTSRYFFALAIPKGAETHWNQTAWGQIIYKTALAAWPAGQHAAPTFAWKIVDGDSVIPNTKGIAPNTRDGYPGHWVLSFSSSFAPKIYNANGSQALVEVDAVKCGYYIQVSGSVAGNGSQSKPGVYLNHSMVALAGYGAEITFGPDASQVGFGQQPLPAGASAVPIGGMVTPQPVAASVVPAVATPAVPVPAPNPAFLMPPAHVMTPLAQGASYEAMIANKWTDALLVQHGMMLP